MILDQAEKLRLMMRHREKAARVLAVTSGKGGVGKSNIASNLAVCLAASGKDVILIDADMGLANLDVLLNVKPRYNLSHVVSGRRPLQDIITPGPAGLRLICGASGLADLADLGDFPRQRLLQEFAALEHQTDVIIIDTGAGISANVLAFCENADHTLVITTGEPTSLTDAYTMIKRLSQASTGVKISLLVNMAESRSQAKKIYQRLANVSQRFLDTVVYDAGYVLRDEHLAQAVVQREPFVLAYPRCQASYCVLALAGKLARITENRDADQGFFRKVVNWFF